MNYFDTILQLTKQLYPTGRAFKMPGKGFSEKLHQALVASEARAYSDALSILDSALPDNENFSERDASDWERRYGLISNPAVLLEKRTQAIRRKMAHPGNIRARQSQLYIEGQLRAAGFDVYVFENMFPDGNGGYITKHPLTLIGVSGGLNVQHGDIQHGDSQHGSIYGNVIVNYIDEELDRLFNIVDLRGTFFIGGNPLGTFASVELSRKAEFRQLILKLKPAHLAGFLFVNYI
jgi:hypothetical protein